jgi:hypothetical protein
MNLRNFVLLAFCGVTYYVFYGPVRAPLVAALAEQVDSSGAFPPALDISRPPIQRGLNDGAARLQADGFTFTPVARFDVDARVLSRKDYRFGRYARFCPVDLALGWEDMSREDVISALEIRQSNRFYFWRTREFPIPRRDIETQSANMHIVPATPEALQALRAVRKGDRVRIGGYLVNVRHENGETWRTSTTRTDTGAGACEIVLATRLERVL